MIRAALLVAALVLLAAPPAAEARLRWSGCGDVEAECSRVAVPLDRSGAVPGSVRLRVARYGGPSRKPVLLYLSGGPGGAGVREFADVLFEVEPLARRYRLFSYDQRGTGSSGLIRCRALERDARLRSTRAGEACARSLGARRALYGTDESVEDVEALRVALGADKLTLFGISYGTKLALAYARAHPDRVSRMALDSVLDPDDTDAYGLEPYRAMAPSLAALCPRRCRELSEAPGGDLAQLVDRLRARPMRGLVYGLRGRKHPATLTALALSDLMFDSDYNPAIRAGIPAGVRAALDYEEPELLLRLIDAAEGLSELPGPRTFSAARYGTVCEETPLPWPRGTPFEQREAAAQAEAGRLGPGAFFPFSYAEARADEIDLCLRWPELSPAPAAGGPYPPLPTLILQGGEDLRTPPESSARVAAAVPGAQRVVVPGVGHAVTGGDPSRCGVRRLLAFLRGRSASAPCKRVPTLVPATAVPPANLGAVPGAPEPGVRAQAIAALDVTLDDLTFSLSPALGSPLAGPGLRGGTFRLRRRGIDLHGLRTVKGLRVSGLLPRRGSAELRLAGVRQVTGRVRISPGGVVRGRLGGRRVRGRLRAGPPRPLAGGARALTAVHR